jgi:hypothetical protein
METCSRLKRFLLRATASSTSVSISVKYSLKSKSSVDRIVEPLVQRNIPWSSTYGNHDRSSTCTPRTFLNREKAFNTGGKRLAWTESSVPGNDDTVGSSNYFIPVYSSSDGRKLVMMLWFFDSRAGGTFGKKTGNGKDLPLEDYVHQDVCVLSSRNHGL